MVYQNRKKTKKEEIMNTGNGKSTEGPKDDPSCASGRELLNQTGAGRGPAEMKLTAPTMCVKEVKGDSDKWQGLGVEAHTEQNHALQSGCRRTKRCRESMFHRSAPSGVAMRSIYLNIIPHTHANYGSCQVTSSRKRLLS